MPPRISIITPSYNQGKYIERTIQSVLSQGVDGLEYLVIDGGSTDETIEILKRYGDRFYWVSERDRGHADAINKGIMRSSGPIIGWLNSDDIYYPGALATVLEYFDTHPETEVVYGDANHIDENDAFIEKYPTEPWNWERLLETCYISQPATFLRRSVFDRYGLLDISLRQSIDYEYWIRLGKNGVRFDYLPVLLAATRLHGEAFTVRARIACHKANNDFMRRHFGKVPDQWIFNYAHAVVETNGFRRADRFRFAVAVSLVSLYASLRWNRGISSKVLRTTTFWIAANARNVLRKRFAKCK
ncbi:glycosyltransferase family 2 protein [Thermogutta sp.]|uniref:glycosyltransferase family 2 protein n=1 Tax=Thermogutta sp. TaxID=1962930 RepID=UPI0032204DC0